MQIRILLINVAFVIYVSPNITRFAYSYISSVLWFFDIEILISDFGVTDSDAQFIQL